MARCLIPLAVVSCIVSATPAAAQSLGTFRWQLQPFGSVLELTVTQQGSIYLLNGREVQCGNNPVLPVWGVAVPQSNGSIVMGLTTITQNGNGLHTRATIPSGFNGVWRDNANQTGDFVFNPGNTCPGGPRISPIVPDAAADPIASLLAEMESLKKRLADLESKQQ